jgi:hypothetical protein
MMFGGKRLTSVDKRRFMIARIRSLRHCDRGGSAGFVKIPDFVYPAVLRKIMKYRWIGIVGAGILVGTVFPTLFIAETAQTQTGQGPAPYARIAIMRAIRPPS